MEEFGVWVVLCVVLVENGCEICIVVELVWGGYYYVGVYVYGRYIGVYGMGDEWDFGGLEMGVFFCIGDCWMEFGWEFVVNGWGVNVDFFEDMVGYDWYVFVVVVVFFVMLVFGYEMVGFMIGKWVG